MKYVLAALLPFVLAACANRQPAVSELKVPSQPVAGVVTAAAPLSFCLHIRYANQPEFVLIKNRAEAWVTDGSCDVDGPRRLVAEVSVRWRFEHDNPGSKTCTAADGCAMDDTNVGAGRRLACVSARARDPGLEAAASTDWYACAR